MKRRVSMKKNIKAFLSALCISIFLLLVVCLIPSAPHNESWSNDSLGLPGSICGKVVNTGIFGYISMLCFLLSLTVDFRIYFNKHSIDVIRENLRLYLGPLVVSLISLPINMEYFLSTGWTSLPNREQAFPVVWQYMKFPIYMGFILSAIGLVVHLLVKKSFIKQGRVAR